MSYSHQEKQPGRKPRPSLPSDNSTGQQQINDSRKLSYWTDEESCQDLNHFAAQAPAFPQTGRTGNFSDQLGSSQPQMVGHLDPISVVNRPTATLVAADGAPIGINAINLSYASSNQPIYQSPYSLVPTQPLYSISAANNMATIGSVQPFLQTKRKYYESFANNVAVVEKDHEHGEKDSNGGELEKAEPRPTTCGGHPERGWCWKCRYHYSSCDDVGHGIGRYCRHCIRI